MLINFSKGESTSATGEATTQSKRVQVSTDGKDLVSVNTACTKSNSRAESLRRARLKHGRRQQEGMQGREGKEAWD